MFSPPSPDVYVAQQHIEYILYQYGQLVESNHILHHNNVWSMEELGNRIRQINDLQHRLACSEDRCVNLAVDLQCEKTAHIQTTSHMVVSLVVNDLINNVVATVAMNTVTSSMSHLQQKVQQQEASLDANVEYQHTLLSLIARLEEVNDTTGVLLAVALKERDDARAEVKKLDAIAKDAI